MENVRKDKIFITGDTHRNFYRFTTGNFPELKDCTKEDVVIIAGDCGITWDDSKLTKHWQKWLEDKPFTVAFCDGNHEGFDILNSLPVEEWNGGKIHRVSDSIIHLMRGQVFDIGGFKFFTFGGAQSHDIEGGILEPDDPYLAKKKRLLHMRGLNYRINHVSWWQEEMPSVEEMDEGLRNLQKHNLEVDFIISHEGPYSIVKNFGAEINELNNYLDSIKQITKYTNWFFGHHHRNEQVDEKHVCLYDAVIQLNDPKEKTSSTDEEIRDVGKMLIDKYLGALKELAEDD